MGTRDTTVVIIAVTLGIAGGAAVNDAVQPAFFTSLFGTRVRYSGVSLGREGGTMVGGGLTPLIATALLTWANSTWAVSAFMALTSLAGFGAVFLARPVPDEEGLTKATKAQSPQVEGLAPASWPVVDGILPE
ncbi:hypothetical protein [Streptomyces sp. NPDC002588]|uniref:hypothetical protein n=1 Tax=Streptomyces sp. NPDC002588 TaxID=3154419 RepID=UPI003320A0A2